MDLELPLLIIRIALGLTLAAHGYNKFFKGGRIEGTGRWFDSMGMRPGKAHAFLAACGEIGSGLFLAMGLLTSFAAFRVRWIDVSCLLDSPQQKRLYDYK